MQERRYISPCGGGRKKENKRFKRCMKSRTECAEEEKRIEAQDCNTGEKIFSISGLYSDTGGISCGSVQFTPRPPHPSPLPTCLLEWAAVKTVRLWDI